MYVRILLCILPFSLHGMDVVEQIKTHMRQKPSEHQGQHEVDKGTNPQLWAAYEVWHTTHHKPAAALLCVLFEQPQDLSHQALADVLYYYYCMAGYTLPPKVEQLLPDATGIMHKLSACDTFAQWNAQHNAEHDGRHLLFVTDKHVEDNAQERVLYWQQLHVLVNKYQTDKLANINK